LKAETAFKLNLALSSTSRAKFTRKAGFGFHRFCSKAGARLERGMTEQPTDPGGLWQRDGAGWRIALELDGLLGWHRWPGPVAVRWLEGDPAVLSYSENGHDAAARHLGPRADLRALSLPAATWLTAETLGRHTALRLTPAGVKTLGAPVWAPDGWRPTPLPPGGGY
jgi:hypothetical protein